jgi:hypothetical protein
MASITYPSLIFDGRNQRIVSFGGFTDTNPAFGMGELTLDETYQLRLVPALSLWEFFPLIGGMRPIPSNGHHGVYDGLNQRFVVHGGFRGFGTGPSGETWALDLSGVRQTWGSFGYTRGSEWSCS